MTYTQIVPRARLGFIIPSSNRMVEPQMARYCPAGIVPHFQRIGMTNRHKAPLDQLLPRILDAAEMLADSRVDVTVLQCTGTSMSGGVGEERKTIAAIAQRTGKPAISAASSLTSAFAALGVRRMVFVSETAQKDHDRKLAFLKEAGFDIVADKAVGLAGSDTYCITPPQLWLDTTTALQRDDADCYFVSCANIHAIDAIESIEAVVERPVVTSNQAALWCALRTVGIKDRVAGLGRLMEIDTLRDRVAAE